MSEDLENLSDVKFYVDADPPGKCFNVAFGMNVKSNFSLYSLYYAGACNEFAGPISTLLRPCNTAPFEEMPQRW